MPKTDSKDSEMGVSTEPQVQDVVPFVVEDYDDDIRSSRNMTKQGGYRPLAASVQKVFDQFKACIDYAIANDGKAQVTFNHQNYPLKGRFANKDITNALVSSKKKFENISFQLIVDAVNRDGNKLNASVVRFKVKEVEAETEATQTAEA
jgi:hypothetical protein